MENARLEKSCLALFHPSLGGADAYKSAEDTEQMVCEKEICSPLCIGPGRKLKVKTDPTKENWLKVRLRIWAPPSHSIFHQFWAHSTPRPVLGM